MQFDSALAQWAYIAACLAVPATWGAVSAWWFSRRDARRAERNRAAARSRGELPPIDYMI